MGELGKRCAIFREPGKRPEMTPFAQGAFTRGYSVEVFNPHEFQTHHPPLDGRSPFDSFDLVVIGGGPTRFNGGAEQIRKYYRRIGTPVVICEFGRLVPGTIMTMVNRKPWVPALGLASGERAEKLGLTYDPKPRGDEILFIGQNPGIDSVLLHVNAAQIRAATDRKIVFRQHPYSRRPDITLTTWLEISCPAAGVEPGSPECEADLQQDLDRAWAVVTHSSLVAVTALRRGIPVFSGPDCPAAGVCFGMSDLSKIDSIHAPARETIEVFLQALAFTIWFENEIRSGQALAFLEGWF